MSEDRTQASITIKGQLDESFSKSFKDALKDIKELDKSIKNLGKDSDKLSQANNKLGDSQKKVNDTQNKMNNNLKKGNPIMTQAISNLRSMALGYLSLRAAGAAALAPKAPKRVLKRSTRPPMSRVFCLPV